MKFSTVNVLTNISEHSGINVPKNNHSAKVQEGFVVQIQSNPSHGYLYRIVKGDGWKIIAAEQYYMVPTLPEINDLIAQWSSSKKYFSRWGFYVEKIFNINYVLELLGL